MDSRLVTGNSAMNAAAGPAGGALGLNEASSVLPQAVAPAETDPAAAAYKKKASEAAVKFESFFIGHMLKQMRSSTKELAGDDSIYKDSINSDMLDMADNMVADQMANQRAFGIADAILRQLLPKAPAAPAAPMPATAIEPAAQPAAQKISTKT
ncbi:rod-binding protein [Pseudoduganella sp. SL102]|uniref:rod-binding protein n=1 Tax=Pseudoduganella sp. SL102 TaxID=2995154 RepID=UPI00248B6096|nr:rod-binding protein [Pseudoduganella sp. SL102]WBS00842.1 rod-binding protein [Pseudoduganella sp. SL102]